MSNRHPAPEVFVFVQLKSALTKLPVRFNAEALAAEVHALPPEAWRPHPQGYPGNAAIPLVTPAGELTDEFAGPMGPTPYLLQCKYVVEAMAWLGGVWGRSRLMRLGAGAEVPSHVDINYYWRTHLRIHIPVITNPDVLFTCGDQTVHMAPGECWVFDSFRDHNVQNKGAEHRVHLVLDTVGGLHLWDLINLADAAASSGDVASIEPGSVRQSGLAFEQLNSPKVMSPWELRCHISYLTGQCEPHAVLDQVEKLLERFTSGWVAAWAVYGEGDVGLPTYRQLVTMIRSELHRVSAGPSIMLRNGRFLYHVLDGLLFENAIAPARVQQSIQQAELARRRAPA